MCKFQPIIWVGRLQRRGIGPTLILWKYIKVVYGEGFGWFKASIRYHLSLGSIIYCKLSMWIFNQNCRMSWQTLNNEFNIIQWLNLLKQSCYSRKVINLWYCRNTKLETIQRSYHIWDDDIGIWLEELLHLVPVV